MDPLLFKRPPGRKKTGGREMRYMIEASGLDGNWDSDVAGNCVFESRAAAVSAVESLESAPDWAGYQFRLLVDVGDGDYRRE